MSDWTDERIALATKLWRDGLTAQAIANRLGGGLSRNAVVGKLTRIGVAGDRKGKQNYIAPRPKTRRGAEVRSVQNRINAGSFAPKPPPKPRPSTPVLVSAENRPLMALGPRHCRWPITDPPAGRMDETLFCAAPKSAEHPAYCAFHARASVAKIQPPAPTARSLRRYA